MRRAWLLLCILPLLVGGARDRFDLKRARSLMSAGQYRRAATLFRDVIARDPKSGAAQVGLGRAMAEQGKCPAALQLLGQWRGHRRWNGRAAASEGFCLHRLGDASAAEAAYRESLTLQPRKVRAWYLLGRLAMDHNDWAVVAEAKAALLDSEQDAGMLPLLEGFEALERGTDPIDWYVRNVAFANRGNLAHYGGLIAARRLMDEGDPHTALPVLRRALKRHFDAYELNLWLAEILRRTGEPEEAEEVLHRRHLQRGEGSRWRSVKARVLVDLGRLDEAQALVDTHPDPFTAHALASAWYLAKAKGADARALERAWRGAHSHPHRRLDRLFPAE